jgi:lipopolysaccharide/colanic/teichoic acid biosynthesis glycosyltransferase
MRHRIFLTVVDLCLIALATFGAQLLRDNFETRPEQFLALLPYLGATLAIAVPIVTVFGLNKSIWRLSSMADYLRAAIATLAIVTGAVVLGFIFNRLEGVARSLPILQAALVLCALVGVRVVSRLHHMGRDDRFAAPHGLPSYNSLDAPETVLLVGINRITELYLRSVAEFSLGQIKVAGLLATKERHTGRLVQEHTILGMPEEIASVLRSLEVHGVCTDRIVITVAFHSLSARAQAALLEVERDSNIKVEFFADNIGIIGRTTRLPPANETLPKSDRALEPTLDPARLEADVGRPYWRVKRVIDLVAVTTALLLLAPLMLLVAALVALDVGLPAIFWQQRPGKDGRPFRLYKFRTMRAAHDSEGRRIADVERLSLVGNLLRRLRLDELPQLYNVMMGQMSFIGPRPLLPHDQFPALAARLSVRPGLTGWAQIKGGRNLTPSDKAALDIWYVRNGSLWVDAKIFVATLRTIVFGERTDADAIRDAWRELGPKRLSCESVEPSSSPDSAVSGVKSDGRVTYLQPIRNKHVAGRRSSHPDALRS